MSDKLRHPEFPLHFFYKRTNPSASRNQQPILDVLQNVWNSKAIGLKLLEISSGTGQHSAHLAKILQKNISFQPSEYGRDIFASIQAYADEAPNLNIKGPVFIDISKTYDEWNLGWKRNEFDYALNINMIHITPRKCTEGLFQTAGKALKNQGMLVTYGSYDQNGVTESPLNMRLNAILPSKNPQ